MAGELISVMLDGLPTKIFHLFPPRAQLQRPPSRGPTGSHGELATLGSIHVHPRHLELSGHLEGRKLLASVTFPGRLRLVTMAEPAL